jgi:hypothetical protein
VSDPEKLLKPKGYLKSTVASAGKVYQPKVTQVNAKVPIEELTLKKVLNKFILQRHQLVNLRLNSKTPEVIVPEIKVEIDPTDTFTSENKRSLSIPVCH